MSLSPPQTWQVSNSVQQAAHPHAYSHGMKVGIQLLSVELDGNDGLLVTFSDGTTGGYVIEELLELRPFRERVKIKKARIPLK